MRTRNLFVSISLMALLVLVLTSVSLAAPDRPNGVIDVKLIDQAQPSAPLGKSTIGDYVWHDTNANGEQDPGEVGIDGVIVNLYLWTDANNDGIQDPGEVVLEQSMPTGDDPDTAGTQYGWYDFDVTADGNVYIVEIAPSNFAGGALEGYALTSALTYWPTPVVVDMPDLIMDISDIDFGYALTSLTVTKNPPTQILLVGSTATFQIIVRNTGEVYIKNIDLTDAYPGAVCIPDPIPGPLAPGATATATCTVTNVQEGFINYVSATATPSTPGGTPLTGDTPSGNSGPAEVLIAHPAIDVEKYVSIDGGATWVDADTVTGPYLNNTTNPQFRFTVTNNGNVPLHTITLADSDFSLSGCTIPPTLAVGGSFSCTITVSWLAGQHTDTATTTGKYTDSSNVTATVQDADDANYFGANPAIDVEKYVSIDNGATWQDADTVTGPYLNSGTNPRFRFTVTNTGNVTLTNITLVDNTYSLAGCTVPASLAVGASFSCTITPAWAAGQHTDTATASGQFTDGNGNTQTKTDQDNANYFGANPAIDVEKYVSIDGGTTWVDADTVTGPYLNSGTNPQFRFTVTNTGNVTLTNITLADNTYSLAGCTVPASLAVGASFSCTITPAWAAGQHTDTATASGQFTDGNGATQTVTDQDNANYFGANPAIDVEKYVSIDNGATWQDADTVTGPYLNGATVAPQFKFVVTNTGNVPLSNVTVTDSDFTLPAGCIVTSLAVGASDDCIITATWAAGQHTDTATASGSYTDGNGNTETDTDVDDANYFGSNPEIDVEKYVSIDGGLTWVDADTVTGPYLNGATVAPQFKFVVTNTGNVPLSNVTVTDSDFTLPAGCIVTSLAVGASDDCIITATWAAGQHTDTATASGSYTDGNGNTETDTDVDDANYYGSNPAIDVEKYVSIDGGLTWVDADTVTGPYLNGATVAPQFKFVVTNTGNVALSNVTVTDSDFTLPAGCIVTSLAVGASDDCIITPAWAAGQHTDTATASGQFTDGNGATQTVTDQDDANYYGSNPEIDVEKYVSVDGGATWVDADTAPGPTLLAGGNPQFKFVVTNIGNVPLSNVTVTDSDFAIPAGCIVTSLAVGASDDCIITAPWAAGQHTNTATANGSYTDGNGNTETDTDVDDANYLGVASSIGNFVWWDVNGNGVQDAGEPGIPGVDVTLFGYPADTTDAGGLYTFENLPNGSYVPTIPASEFAPGGTLFGFTATPPFLGGNPATDSNGVSDGMGGIQAAVNLPTNTANMTIDFGFVKPTSYMLTKTAVTVGPVTPGDPIQFHIQIHNTGQTYISVLPLVDTFDPLYLQFVLATPMPDLQLGGTLTWTDLTGAGMLAPDSFFDVYLNFVAVEDTTALPPDGETINTATVKKTDTRVDPDGPGGVPEAVPPVNDLTSQDGIMIIRPTGVTLAAATVTVGPDGVLVAWETADESAILGFNVLADGVAVNAELILASASGLNAGAAYTFLDAGATGESAYVLEIIKLDGTVERIVLQ